MSGPPQGASKPLQGAVAPPTPARPGPTLKNVHIHMKQANDNSGYIVNHDVEGGVGQMHSNSQTHVFDNHPAAISHISHILNDHFGATKVNNLRTR